MSYSFGATDSPIDLGEDFELVSVSPSEGIRFTNWVGRNRSGDYIPATNQQRNKRTDVVATFRAIKPDGATATVVLGGTGENYDGFVATAVRVRQTNNEDATVEVMLHANDGNSGLHGARSVSVAIPSSGYGVVAAPLTGTAPPENCIGMEWAAEVGHVDRTGRLGDHLIGFSHGCLLQCTQEYVDDAGSITAGANWHIDEDLPAEVNTDARTRRVSGHSFKALA